MKRATAFIVVIPIISIFIYFLTIPVVFNLDERLAVPAMESNDFSYCRRFTIDSLMQINAATSSMETNALINFYLDTVHKDITKLQKNKKRYILRWYNSKIDYFPNDFEYCYLKIPGFQNESIFHSIFFWF